MKQIEVVAAIIHRDGAYFATQRGYGEFEGMWEFPGGKIEPGESREDALKREIQEELGVDIYIKELLCTTEPLDIVQNEIIPALDIVGKGFENKTVYLPQLLMSAEAAKSAFEIIKAQLSTNSKSAKAPSVISTAPSGILSSRTDSLSS